MNARFNLAVHLVRAYIKRMCCFYSDLRLCVQRIALVFALVFVPVALSTVRAGDRQEPFLNLYEELLRDHVRLVDGGEIPYAGVDYDGWSEDQRHQSALDLLLNANPPAGASENKQKAFWINAYNFLTIDLIVREGERESIRDLGGLFSSPWTKFSWEIAGREYTLDFIEHDILRPLGDPRIHFAINCASVSCPDLRGEAYQAEDLNVQLDDQVKQTLANPGKGLWREGDRVYVSKIFDWFDEDFNGGDVQGWLRENADISDQFSVRYLKYDWALNKLN